MLTIIGQPLRSLSHFAELVSGNCWHPIWGVIKFRPHIMVMPLKLLSLMVTVLVDYVSIYMHKGMRYQANTYVHTDLKL